MNACHFQDIPGKRSLCLRDCLASGRGPEAPTYYCTEAISSACPHRAWDHESSVRLQREKAALLGLCSACGCRHSTVSERMRCVLDRRIEAMFGECGKECGGSCDPVLPRGVPPEMASYAWRKIRERVLERDGHRCRRCGRTVDGMPSWFFEVHHVVPRREGGSNHPRNLVTLCYLCHKKTTALGGRPDRDPSIPRRF